MSENFLGRNIRDLGFRAGPVRRNRRPEKNEDDSIVNFFNGAFNSRDGINRKFEGIKMKISNEEKPMIVFPDGHIFIEAFSPFFRQAQDFAITIAEPVSRPEMIHEYQITAYSLFIASSIGITAQEIIRTLSILSKIELSSELIEQIQITISSVGKIKLVLWRNRFFIESTQIDILVGLLNDKIFNDSRINSPQEGDEIDDISGFYRIESSNDSTIIPGIGSISKPKDFILDELDPDDSIIEKNEKVYLYRFEVRSDHIETIREHSIQLNLPISYEYDFHNDFINENLKIDLKSSTNIRPYQEKSLSMMFSGSRANSGIIVLPCGAGKTLVGICAICTIMKSTIIICNSSISASQWDYQIKKWTNIDYSLVIQLTSKRKSDLPDRPCILITTYGMIASSGPRSEKSQRVLNQITNREWGLMIFDEVQESVAPESKKVSSKVHSHCKIGLTATLLREDNKINDLRHIVGPKLYEANWLDLANNNFLARVKCYEIWCKMTSKFYKSYLEKENEYGIKKIIASVNPNKLNAAETLIKYHENRNDKILVFCDIIWVLKLLGDKLHLSTIHGAVPDDERERIFNQFKNTNKLNCIVISRVGDKAIDLPSANVLIQVCSHYGSRMQESQRLGRILRQKSGKNSEYNAYFYTLVSEDTEELFYGAKRQQFLIDQGYTYEIVQNVYEKWGKPYKLRFESEDEQRLLLERCINASETDGKIESIISDDESINTMTSSQLSIGVNSGFFMNK